MVTAASAAALKLGYSAMKAKQMDEDRERAGCFYNSNYEIWEMSALWSLALHLR